MPVRIHKPSRNAMQSGKAKYDHWFVEFEAATPRTVDPLMGWTSSGDMHQQVKLSFPTKEEAIAYCESCSDYATRDLLSAILASEEEHIGWLETQLGLIERLGLAWIVRTVFGFFDFDDFVAAGAGHVHKLALESFDIFARRIDTSEGYGDIAGGCQFAVTEIFPFAASFLPDEFCAFIEDAFFFDGFAMVHLPERSVAKE
jgi:hypothetical protein